MAASVRARHAEQRLIVGLGAAGHKGNFVARCAERGSRAIARCVERGAGASALSMQGTWVKKTAVGEGLAESIRNLAAQRRRRRVIEINSLLIHRSLTVYRTTIGLCEAPTHTPRSSNGKLAVRESLGPPVLFGPLVPSGDFFGTLISRFVVTASAQIVRQIDLLDIVILMRVMVIAAVS
jgi:hypothetical protein